MTNKEVEFVRYQIGTTIDTPPDEIEVIKARGDKPTLYSLHDYMGYNLVLGYDSIPNLVRIREDIKDLYLAAVEWDWDEENPL